MITYFDSIDVGNPFGCFNTLANDCISLASQYSCKVLWVFNGVQLQVMKWSNVDDLWSTYQEKLYK
jgi:hypothetical protein